jgi:hypothetical protein
VTQLSLPNHAHCELLQRVSQRACETQAVAWIHEIDELAVVPELRQSPT